MADVALADISEVLKQDDRFVWIGLYEPDEALLKEVQAEFGLHDLAIEDAHLAHQRPKLERYGDSLFIALRTAQPDREQRPDRLRRDPPLRGRPLRGLGPPRGLPVLRRRARALRGAAAAPRQGTRLRAPRHHGLRGGPVLPDRGRARGRPGRPRGRDLQRAHQPRDDHADLHPQARPARDQAGRLPARRHLQPPDADGSRPDPRRRAPLFPRRLRPRAADQREGRRPPRAARDRARGQSIPDHHCSE